MTDSCFPKPVIDLELDVKCVAEALEKDLTKDQINFIAEKIFHKYSFNEWIEELIEEV